MDKQMREFAQKVFSGDDPDHKPCDDCGGVHTRACPRIASLRLVIGTVGDEKGVVVERDVTYWAPGVWEKDVTFADEVWGDDDDEPDTGSGD